MYIVRYRTHGPWQSEPVDTWEKADHLSSSLSKTYTHVVVDQHQQCLIYKDGKLKLCNPPLEKILQDMNANQK